MQTMETTSQRKRKRYQKNLTASDKKRRKKDSNRRLRETRINIQSQKERWTLLKKKEKLKTDEEMAKFLLDFYNMQFTSTPMRGKLSEKSMKTPGLSGISESQSAGSTTETAVSGVDDLEETIPAEHMGSQCFGDKEMSSDDDRYTDNADADSGDSDDEDPFGLVEATKKEKSFHPEASTASEDSLDITTMEDECLSFAGCNAQSDDDEQDDGDSDIDDDDDDILYSLIEGVTTVTSAEDIYDEPCTIAYKSALHLLAAHAPRHGCTVNGCGKTYEVNHHYKGTAMYMTWVCQDNHKGFTWCSQPKLRAKGVHAGDYMLGCSLLLSGNNYSKISLMAKFMNLNMFRQNFFYQIQSLYLCPVIEETWVDVQKGIHKAFKTSKKPLILAGDGRNDSPGHSAMYCTYTLLELETKDIVDIVVIDKREVALKSTVMEAEGLRRSLNNLKKAKLTVKELATDAHSQIGSMMKKEFPTIVHSWDVWHGSKNLVKKLHAAATEKSCVDLAPWVKDIQNHFWYCSQKADGSEQLMKARWHGVLHHIVNQHEWLIGLGGPGECEHGTIDDQHKDWLVKGGAAHEKLRQVVLDTRFLNTLKYYVNFRHTGELETFHNHILMYAAKRFAFSYLTYRARNLLAVLDYQSHKNRETKKDGDGNDRQHRLWSKRSAIWTTVPVKVEKTYTYIPAMIKKMVAKCIADKQSLKRKIILPETHPKRISSTIAKVPPPPTKDIMAKKVSRFKSKVDPVGSKSELGSSSSSS